ncbi:hypothetical protein ACP70R_042712 [Stipagrostis hirtigluma subsp. patula]
MAGVENGHDVHCDKGFKEVHHNTVAKDVSDFTLLEVSGTQVYNHLRKWRSRWVKIYRLKEISGALWDENNYMIVLEPEHLKSYTKDHPKDSDMLNVPLENYVQMQIIFGSGVATGRFAMGSSEPLGKGAEEAFDVDADMADAGKEEGQQEEAQGGGQKRDAGKKKADSPTLGKRKRISEEEGTLMSSMIDAIWGFAAAVSETAHAKAAPGVYPAVMGTPGFTRKQLMKVLGYLTENKASGIVFVQTEADRELWINEFLINRNLL